jgi:TDG/mug DNA glycosylase family protein
MSKAQPAFRLPRQTGSAPGATLPDVIAADLAVLFCGLNPGLKAAATGHHFEGRSNRFWRVLHLAGFTPQQMSPMNDRDLLAHGCGITAVVERATASAAEVSTREYMAAAHSFQTKIETYRPTYIAFLGKAAYKAISVQREVDWGRQRATFGGSAVWVLPNPSGLNRAFSLDNLAAAYNELYQAVACEQRTP